MDTDARGRTPRKLPLIMAASAAMIVAGMCAAVAHAQDAGEAASAAPPPSNSLTLVNQVQSLRDQMQQMQNQLELLQHQVQQLQQASKDQYVDLDSRVGKLEHAESAAPAQPAAPTSAEASSGTPGKTVPPAPSKPVSTADKAAAQADYDAAFKALRAGNFVDSARGFRAFIDKYPDNPLVPNAYYWLGGSYYVTQNYKVALTSYQTLVQKYPGSSRVPEAQLRIADCQIGLKDYPAARAGLQALIKAHPGTPLEKRAREKLRDIPASASAK